MLETPSRTDLPGEGTEFTAACSHDDKNRSPGTYPGLRGGYTPNPDACDAVHILATTEDLESAPPVSDGDREVTDDFDKQMDGLHQGEATWRSNFVVSSAARECVSRTGAPEPGDAPIATACWLA